METTQGSPYRFEMDEGFTIFAHKFRKQLWDCALANCGYDIAAFPCPPRPSVYGRPCRFIRWYFEDLWSGSVHLRPDYENEKSTIYFSDSEEVGELEEVDNSDSSDSEDGGVRLASDDENHSERCCPSSFWIFPS